ncbi:ATP-binding protein [Aurantimonas sp. Leaf443]|uniref:sensor histidine kinase n=1 Tax=Aurantimonas sp. Leaf443 TaxID=1736378 RepID=UPI0006F56222|nr:ATP-binding protein [Aurantimonas sp. Leaf443]KQT86179.1 histidine kinase [Aurantimonas sp. Leaf443]
MSLAPPPTYDSKLMPRPRAAGEGGELGRTLQAARDRLSSRGGLSPRFDRELLAQHAAALTAAAMVLPLPVALTGLALSIFTGPLPAGAWALGALLAYAVLMVICRQFQAQDQATLDPRRWRRIFLVGHAAVGLSWAYFATLDCQTCGPAGFDLFQFSTLLIVIAVTAMVSSPLRAVVPLAFAPVVAALLLEVLREPEPLLGAMKIIVVASVPFFAVVAERLRRASIERLKHQAEKDELIAELETARNMSDEARRRAEEANLAKSRFLATMSHELRTPLNAILGFSEVMGNEILGPVGNAAYKDYIGDIHSSGQHLLGLINEILDLSRVEAGRYALHEEAIDLSVIARDSLGYVRLKAEQKGLTLKAEYEPELPALWGDDRAVRQIVINLLSNAVKFTPRGGVVWLRVGWTAGGGQYVSVRDDGPGIPPEEIPVVLSSFGQGSLAIKSAEQGTGLGLPIVQSLVQMHDGEFQLLSKLREGTEAIAIFPHSRVLEVMPAIEDYV